MDGANMTGKERVLVVGATNRPQELVSQIYCQPSTAPSMAGQADADWPSRLSAATSSSGKAEALHTNQCICCTSIIVTIVTA